MLCEGTNFNWILALDNPVKPSKPSFLLPEKVLEELLHGFLNLLHGFLKVLHDFVDLLHGFLNLLHGFLNLLHGFVELLRGFLRLLRAIERYYMLFINTTTAFVGCELHVIREETRVEI
jgi:hypothetical protein